MAHSVVVAKITERTAANKQGWHRFNMEGFSLKNFNEVKVKYKYHVEVPNTIAAFEDLDAEVELILSEKRLGRISEFHPKRV
jgi:hypothetical protein